MANNFIMVDDIKLKVGIKVFNRIIIKVAKFHIDCINTKRGYLALTNRGAYMQNVLAQTTLVIIF